LVWIALFIHAADNIISMTNGGCIKEQGPPATLTLSSIQNTPKDSASEEPSDSPQQDAVEKLVRRDPVQDDSAADLARQSGDMRMYAYYFGSIGVMPTAVYLLFLTAVLFGAMFQGVWLKLWSEAESREPNKHTWQYLGGLLGLGFMSEIGIIFGLLALYLLMAPRASVKIHRRLLTAVFNSPYHFFVDVDNGVTLNRFSQDMSLIDVDMPTGWLQTSDGALAVLFSAILILIVSKYMAAFVPGLIVVLYFLQRFYLRTSRQMRFLDLEAKSPLYTNFLETLGGLNTIKAFKWQNAWRSQNLAFLDSSQKPFYLLYCIQRWLNFVLDMTVAAVAVIVMTLATQLPHQTSGGYLGLALTNLVEFSTTLAYLITAWTQLETSIGAVARVSSFEKSTRREDPQAHLLETVPENWPERGEIIFGNTSSCYR
jgi:ATP-binding cassette, subfamily C (CFTR/MRP), member 1